MMNYCNSARFHVLVATNMKIAVFWDVVTVTIEAASTSETSVNF
jgi:hypothetical protein